jgi:hypothetical protein
MASSSQSPSPSPFPNLDPAFYPPAEVSSNSPFFLESSKTHDSPNDSEVPQSTLKRKRKTGGDKLAEAINSFTREIKEGREQREKERKIAYERAIELLFAEYKEQDSDWQFKACKALEHGQNALIFLATKQRKEIKCYSV